MGLVSRKIFPACESMCVCCPALRSRSRQPVKRYKKLLAEIFPKSLNGVPNERKIVKLCEYAAKNPFRIPKIAKYLEERCYKELRSEQIKFITIVAEAYSKMLRVCNEQMVYFAASLLNVVTELLDNSKQDGTRILGCQILTRFIYSQKDGTYTHNIEKFIHKVCKLVCEEGEEHQKRCLRASGLHCVSAMVWFMGEFNYIFAALDEVVHVTLDNYKPDMSCENYDNTEETTHHNWVNEVIRCEGRGTAMGSGVSPTYMILRPPIQRKDPSLLTKEETETPKVWAQICVQRMVEVAKESSTLRRVLDPMLNYFDSTRQWVAPHGLAFILLSDMTHLIQNSGKQECILSAVVRHLDNKNVAHNPELKSYAVQVAACLARQIRTGSVLREIGFVTDLCRHLRKSFQATAESVGEQELGTNLTLQNSIEDCLLEIAKGIGDTRPLFDMMALALERLPSYGIVSQAAVGSLLILAHVISSVSSASRSHQLFPETLLLQLLKSMLHPNVETRVGAHQIFSVLLMPIHNPSRSGVGSIRSSGFLYEPKKWHSDTTSAFASITALLEKLRRQKDGAQIEKNRYNIHEDFQNCKKSPNFCHLSSIIDRTAGPTNLAEMDPFIMKFSEDQIVQLLSAFWMQATLPDNRPSNIEAIAHSFSITLLSLQLESPNDSLIVRFFQLLLSLRSISLEPNNGTLPPVCQRLVLVLSTGMLMFAAKIYHVPHVCDLLKSSLPDNVDPYLGISNDLQVYLRRQANMKELGTLIDYQMATSVLFELRNKVQESENIILDILIKNLATIAKMEEVDVQKQLSEPFTPDYSFIFGPQTVFGLDYNQTHSKESPSSDELIELAEIPLRTGCQFATKLITTEKRIAEFEIWLGVDCYDVAAGSTVEEDVTSQLSVAEMSHLFPKMQQSPTDAQIVSVGQLMESALEVAGQVVGSSVSTSPLPYDTMANRCETFGTGTRTKLSNWLANENQPSNVLYRVSVDDKIMEDNKMQVPCLTMRLPPASPFDNFLKAASC